MMLPPPHHHFCMKCDKKEFSSFEINENLLIDTRAGEMICGKCGTILVDRIINMGSEEVMYDEDYETGNSSKSRSAGHSEFLGFDESVFVNGPEAFRQALERAQKASANRKEMKIISQITLVNELCSKMNLTMEIKVSC
jgi:transcription initiation factor TFIIIB Brf1 subunit/transcription initiation factor TFIIB